MKSIQHNSLFGNPLKDEVDFNDNVETKIDDVIYKKIKSILAWLATILFSAIFGGITVTLWDLNGKIHQIIGQEEVRKEITEIRENRIKLLHFENSLLKKEISSLKLYSNKASGFSK